MRVRVRYLYTFKAPAGALAAALAQGATAITNVAYDLQTERLGDSGADAFTDLETARYPDRPDLIVHRGRYSGLTVVSAAAEVDTADLLQTEQDRTADIVDFVATRVGAAEAPELQWVHRLIVADSDAVADVQEAVLPLAYHPPQPLSRGGACVMGRGYSAVFTRHDDQIDAVELGLVSATQVHMMVDTASREAASLLTEVEPGHTPTEAAANALARRAGALIVRVRHIAEFARRLRVSLQDARGVAFEATIHTWGVGSELNEVTDRVDACVRIVDAVLDRQRSDREARRNVLLFILAMLGVGQVIFAVYDFLTDESTTVGHSPRPFVLGAAVLAVGALIVFDVRRHRSRH